MKLIQIILTLFIPPIGAFMQVGLSTHFWVNLILTLLGYFPGLIHGLWLLLSGQERPA
ncbi:MAG: YqaE/Pmp3 family membrane protein [Opitutales bacterium]